MNYGATPDEWSLWSDVFEMTSDLLPVVCKPGEQLYERSNLKDYGKVPSRYTVQGTVMGFTNWTSNISTPHDVAGWAGNAQYGICLQTRRLRALDFDLLDRAFADDLRAGLSLLGYDFPWRTRADSPKFLTLFEMEGDYGKQTLQTPHGVIEFLANGQQCLVAGTHPRGARYTWDWHYPFPRFTPAEWADLQSCLAKLAQGTGGTGWSSPARCRVTDRSQPVATVVDPVVDFLRATGLVTSQARDGRVFLTCPWADGHTTESDVTATCWFPAGTNGYETGHFRCLHAHCHEKQDWEFLRIIGFDAEGFEVEGPPAHGAAPHPDVGGPPGGEDRCPADHLERPEGDTLHALHADVGPVLTNVAPGTVHPLDLPGFERDTGGKIKPTIGNVVDALLRPDLSGFVIAKDQFKDELMLHPWPLGKLWVPDMTIWTSPKRQEFSDNHYADLHITLRRLGFGPSAIASDVLRLALLKVAADRTFDSAINWTHTLPVWDGVPRIDTFLSRYLGGEDSPYTRAVARYWWSAQAGRILTPGCQADMAIVMISRQGTGKTSTLKAISPSMEEYVEINMTHRDEDLSRSLRGKKVGEMAELNGVRGREVESVKAFISRTHESWIPKYREHRISFPRRLILIGTSNEEEFLVDQTGNRRWLPVMMGKQDVAGVIRDRDQLWAEAMVLYTMEGVLWSEAETLARDRHLDFTVRDEWESVVAEWLTVDDGFGLGKPSERSELILKDVMKGALGLSLSQMNHTNQLRVGRAMRKIGYEKFRTRRDGKQITVWKQGLWEWNKRDV